MPVGKVKQISINMDRECRSSWTGVHEFFQPEEYDAGASPTKQVQVEDNWICTSVHFEDILNLKR
jgi:hypothetical protein